MISLTSRQCLLPWLCVLARDVACYGAILMVDGLWLIVQWLRAVLIQHSSFNVVYLRRLLLARKGAKKNKISGKDETLILASLLLCFLCVKLR